jgi:signal transduction histidine kinase
MPRERKHVPSAWPIFLALAIMVALAAANVIIDLAIDSRIERLTDGIVNNALRSVSLIDDLRGQAQKLGLAEAGPERAAIRARIEEDTKAYEPLATFAGEHAEWVHLRTLLDAVQQADGARPVLLREVNDSIDRLAAINHDEAAHNMEAIRRTQHSSFGLDIISGFIVFGVAGAVMIVVSRLIRNQRRLVEHELDVTLERQRDLEAFAGRVAHDLRHPLTPLRLAAGMLAANPKDPKKLVERIGRNVDDMAAIIENLLVLSTSGKPEPGTTKVSPVITAVLEQAEAELEGAKVSLSVEDCTVGCSSTVLRQIVSNLVTNASKYRSPERALEISISVACVNGFAELTVADNGVGMDAATASHVFEPLFRADATRSIPGHGLGLAIVGRTVRALDGTYSVKSSPGAGSQFLVRIPLVPVAHPGPAVAEAH